MCDVRNTYRSISSRSIINPEIDDRVNSLAIIRLLSISSHPLAKLKYFTNASNEFYNMFLSSEIGEHRTGWRVDLHNDNVSVRLVSVTIILCHGCWTVSSTCHCEFVRFPTWTCTEISSYEDVCRTLVDSSESKSDFLFQREESSAASETLNQRKAETMSQTPGI